jgi:hypothetical protein
VSPMLTVFIFRLVKMVNTNTEADCLQFKKFLSTAAMLFNCKNF